MKRHPLSSVSNADDIYPTASFMPPTNRLGTTFQGHDNNPDDKFESEAATSVTVSQSVVYITVPVTMQTSGKQRVRCANGPLLPSDSRPHTPSTEIVNRGSRHGHHREANHRRNPTFSLEASSLTSPAFLRRLSLFSSFLLLFCQGRPQV